MYDPDEPTGDPPEQTWDEWFGQNYGRGRGGRRLKIYAVLLVAAVIGLYLSGNSTWFHR